MVRHLEGFANYQRLSPNSTLHYPRAKGYVGNEFEAGISEVVGAVDEASEQ